MSHLVITSVKDEGAFLVEWIAWYRMLGFQDILVLSNDCTDHSPELLDLLAQNGVLTHQRVKIPEGQHPTPVKLERARKHPLVAQARWVMVCDVDEFLVPAEAKQGIADLLPLNAGFLAMVFNWRVFGHGGNEIWQDTLVHRAFLRSAAPMDLTSRWFKTAFRHPDWFGKFGEHGPCRLRVPEGADPHHLRRVNSARRAITAFDPNAPQQRLVELTEVDQSRATLHHYMTRSAESFSLKRGTPSSAAGKDRYTDDFLTRYNRNEVENRDALAFASQFDRSHGELLAIPGVQRLHHLSCADYASRLALLALRDPATDARVRAHLSAAEASSRP